MSFPGAKPAALAPPANSHEATGSKECPLVSVIIPTYRRRDLLCETVRHVLRQEYPRLEVIVVDQTEPGCGQGVYVDLQDKVQYLWAAQPNLSLARNLGIEHSQGAILLFCDDDIVPCDNWVWAHVRHYGKPQVMAVAGSETVPDSSLVDRSLRRARWKRMLFRLLVLGQDIRSPLTGGQVTGRVGSRIVAQFSASGAILHDWTVPGTGWVDFAKGCNMSLRREVFAQLGGFDPACTGREETDLFVRIKRAGLGVLYDSSAAVLHLKAEVGGVRTWNALAHYQRLFYYETYFFLKNFPHLYFPLFLLRILPEIAGCCRTGGWRAAPVFWTSFRKAAAAARQARQPAPASAVLESQGTPLTPASDKTR